MRGDPRGSWTDKKRRHSMKGSQAELAVRTE